MNVIEPLNPIQHAFMCAPKTGNGFQATNVGINYNFTGELDVDVLFHAIKKVIKRHEILRTTFPQINGSVVQTIWSDLPTDISFLDLSHLPQKSAEDERRNILTRKNVEPFDLENGPLWSAFLFRLEPEEYSLSFVLSHGLSDFWTQSILLHEILDLYCSEKTGQDSLLKEPLQYREFTKKFLETYTNDQLEIKKSHWKDKLQAARRLKFGDNKNSNPHSFHFYNTIHSLSADSFNELKRYCSKFNVSPFSCILTAVQLYIYQRTGIENFMTDATSSAFRFPGTEQSIGVFISRLAVMSEIGPKVKIKDLVLKNHSDILEGMTMALPFHDMAEVAPPRQFNVNFLTSVPPPCSVSLPGISAKLDLPARRFGRMSLHPLRLTLNNTVPFEPRKYQIYDDLEFTLVIFDANGELYFEFNYNANLFSDEEVKSILTGFESIILEMIAEPGMTVEDLQIQLGERS